MSTTAAVDVRRVRHLYVVPPLPEALPETLPRSLLDAPAGARPAGRSLAARLDLDGLRLTARGRAVIALVTLVLAAPLLWGATAVAGQPRPPVEVQGHAVEPGETLWSLAASVAEPGQDLREVVRELRDLNGLASATLTVGQTVYVPAG